MYIAEWIADHFGDCELELDEEYLNDGPVECDDCGETFSESALYDGLCVHCGAGQGARAARHGLRRVPEHDLPF